MNTITEMKQLTLKNYKQLEQLINTTQETLRIPIWLRKNLPQMLTECLHSRTPHKVVGAYRENELVAAVILYRSATTGTLPAEITLKASLISPTLKGETSAILEQLENTAIQTGSTDDGSCAESNLNDKRLASQN